MLTKRNFPKRNLAISLQKRSARDDTNESPGRYIPLPLQYNPETKFRFRRRFTTTSAISMTFTIFELLGFKLIATTAILGNSAFSVIRMRRLQIWAPVVTQGTPVSIVVTPVSFDSTDNNLNDVIRPITDTSAVIDKYAYVDFVPKKTHPSGMWHTSRNLDDQLFSIVCPIGSILDFDCEGIENTNGFPLGFTRVLVGATAGTIYTALPTVNFAAVGTLGIL